MLGKGKTMANYQYNTQPYQGVTPYVPQQAGAQPAQSPGAAGVNIIIQNPMATTSPINTGYPQAYPSNYYLPQPGVVNNNSPTFVNNNGVPQGTDAPSTSVAAAPVNDAAKTDDKKKKTKDVVRLTDDYIRTLENYLRNPDKEIRTMGIKELQKRFSEDETRKNDAALNSLLNLALQDPADEIRAFGLAILNAGTASGDNNSVTLLKQMQNSDKAYGQDALAASQALLKISGKTVKVPDDSPDKEKKSTTEKTKE